MCAFDAARLQQYRRQRIRQDLADSRQAGKVR